MKPAHLTIIRSLILIAAILLAALQPVRVSSQAAVSTLPLRAAIYPSQSYPYALPQSYAPKTYIPERSPTTDNTGYVKLYYARKAAISAKYAGLVSTPAPTPPVILAPVYTPTQNFTYPSTNKKSGELPEISFRDNGDFPCICDTQLNKYSNFSPTSNPWPEHVL